MIGMLVETVVIAFVMGGIIGAVTALHLNNHHADNPKKIPVRIHNERNKPGK